MDRSGPVGLDFTGRTVAVTGGASGIGAAACRLFARCGGRVFVLDRDESAASRLGVEIGGQAVVVDVADEAMVAAALARCDTGAHPVDVLVNSAGILQSTRAPSEVSMREWDLTLRVNLRGTYLCAAAFGTRMAARGRGAIVNVASVAGMHAGPLHAYGPGKAAVIHMTQCLAAEWGPRGVRVNAVSPGFTRTPALDRGIDMGAIAETQMKNAAALGRLIDAEEIAHAIGFLASDLASAITGINLPVDAGYLVATPWAAYGGLRRAESTAAAPSAIPPTPRARPV